MLDSNFLARLLSLINYTEIINNTKKNELKIELFKELQDDNQNKKISNNNIVYLRKSFKYGNTMILLIKFRYELAVYSQKVIIPEIRINKLKNEIYKNLPKINIDDKDLYIHVRGGDIFKCKKCKDINYSQPPLCFYQKILNKFIFKNIYIISFDNLNPIIEPLINEFPKLIHSHNSLQRDIAILSNAYNLVGSVSSFLTSSILMNNNLKNYFEYDNYRLTEKYLHLHPQIYKYKIKYNVYKMNSSKYYRSKMFPWKNTKFQKDLMLTEKCNDFNQI